MKYYQQIGISDKKPKPYLARMKCSSNRDCSGKNQKCHQDQITKSFCGTKKCRGKRDCKDVGHIVSGKNSAKKCKNAIWKKGQRREGHCIYNMHTTIA